MGLFEHEGDTTKLTSKSQSNLRWVILFLTCLMMIGNYYCYDNPAALKTQIDDYMGNPSDYETLYSLLYTVYSVPNVALPFFGGYFIDTLGVRLCLIVFAGFLLTGQIVFAIGLSSKQWWLMLLGRVIYGFGGESLGVGNSAILSQWFTGKELAFAFGLNLSVARLGSVINNLVSPQVANAQGVVFALWFGAIILGLSFTSTLLMTPIDRGMEILLERNEKLRLPLLETGDEEEDKNLLGGGLSKQSDTENPLLGIENGDDSLYGLDSVKGSKDGLSSPNNIILDSDSDAEGEVKFSSVLKFPASFWLLALSCLVVYGCVLPFNNIASSLLLERNYFIEQPKGCALLIPDQCYNVDDNGPNTACKSGEWYQPPTKDNTTPNCDDDSDNCYKDYCDLQSKAEVQATTVMSIPYIISACLSPVLGGLVDQFGKRAIVAMLAPGVLIIVHSVLGHGKGSPVGPLVGQGISYAAFAAVLWPSIPLVIEPKFIGLGFGVVTAIQNIGLACFPIIIATIYTDYNDHYIPYVENFFVALAAGGFVVGLYLNYYDVNHGYIFNSATKAIDYEEFDDEAGVEDDVTIGGSSSGGLGRHNSRDKTAADLVHEIRRISGDVDDNEAKDTVDKLPGVATQHKDRSHHSVHHLTVSSSTNHHNTTPNRTTSSDLTNPGSLHRAHDRNSGTFTVHEELFRARVVSGEYNQNRTSSRQNSGDIAGSYSNIRSHHSQNSSQKTNTYSTSIKH